MGNNLAGQLDEHEPQLMSILDAEMDARKCNNYLYHYFPLPFTLDIDTVDVHIFACMNFRGFTKIDIFAWIKIRVL